MLMLRLAVLLGTNRIEKADPEDKKRKQQTKQLA